MECEWNWDLQPSRRLYNTNKSNKKLLVKKVISLKYCTKLLNIAHLEHADKRKLLLLHWQKKNHIYPSYLIYHRPLKNNESISNNARKQSGDTLLRIPKITRVHWPIRSKMITEITWNVTMCWHHLLLGIKTTFFQSIRNKHRLNDKGLNSRQMRVAMNF